MSTKSITGIIPIEEENIAFSSIENSFEFNLISNSSFKLPYGQKVIKLTPTNGFICGKTHNAHEIAIYIGDSEFAFSGAANIRTAAYIKSIYNSIDVDIMEYDSIQFIGGTLNDVFHINGMKIKHNGENYIVEKKDDSLKYNIAMEDYQIEIEVFSEINSVNGIYGDSIENKNVILTLSFDKTMSIGSLFEQYNNIKDLLSFLTFRKNVEFDKIFLFRNDEKFKELKVSEVFIKSEEPRTTKNKLWNIRFDDINESIPNLIKLIYEKNDNEYSISLGFLPSNDDDLSLMTNTKIRNIYSALETELSFIEYQEPDSELDDFIEEVRKSAKELKKKYPALSNNLYSQFMQNIVKPQPTLRERLCALTDEYIEELIIMNTSNYIIGEKSIAEFVKYRNGITHGRHRVMDTKMATIAYYMSGLVYCCILTRIGVERSKIKELCKMKILR